MGCFLRWKTKKGGAELNNKQRYENLQHGFYAGAGKYDIPQLTGSKITDFPELIGFNYAKTTKNRQNKGVHFFLDDYQFLRLWNNPTAYLDILKGFRCVLTPDFHYMLIFRQQCRYTIITASIGSVRFGKITELKLFQLYVGATKSHSNGVLTENLRVARWQYHL